MTLPVAASPVEMAPPTGLRSGAVVGMTGERQRSFLPLSYTPMEPETVSCPEVSSRTTIRRARARLHHHQMCCDVVDTLNELDAGASCKAPSSSPSNRVRLPPSSAGEPAWTWHSAASLKEEFGLQLQPGAMSCWNSPSSRSSRNPPCRQIKRRNDRPTGQCVAVRINICR